MCRHLAWVGRPRSLSSLVLEPGHGLLTQSYAPRRQRYGRVNADGWGVGFYAPGRAEPARWRSARPLWGEASFASVAPVLSSSCVIAAVRCATVGMPMEETAAAPFVAGKWLVSHNGRLRVDAVPFITSAESTCDSALLSAYLAQVGVERMAEVVVEIAARDPDARLNLLAVDGAQAIATTWGDTLSVLQDRDGVVLASEPYDDDPRWVDLPDKTFVRVTPDGITCTAITPDDLEST